MKNSNAPGAVNFYNPATDDTVILTAKDGRAELLTPEAKPTPIEVSLTLRFQDAIELAIDDLSNLGTKLPQRALVATGVDRDGNMFQITLNVSKDRKSFMPTGGREVALGELVPELPRGRQS